jgi:hypothetical protein
VHGASWRATAVAAAAIGASTVVSGAGSAVPQRSAEHATVTTEYVETDAELALRQRTRVRRVSPLNDAGHLSPRYAVVGRGRGSCLQTSHVHGRAYRCFERNIIRDPCWKESGRQVAFCLIRPWSLNVTRLRLTERLPRADESGGRLWGLRLGDGIGTSCLFAQGATGVVNGRRLNYDCGRGWWLLGEPNRRPRVWTILTAKQDGRRIEPRGRKPLTAAWRPVVR